MVRKGSVLATEKTFWNGMIKKDENDCWIWVRCNNGSGYGITTLKGIRYLTHRLAYEITYGAIPKGMYVLHTCDNPSCCNPKHLKLGTQFDNMKDMTDKKRRVVGEDSHYSKLSEKHILEIRELYSTGNYTQRELSKRYNISFQGIHVIVKRKSWKHI